MHSGGWRLAAGGWRLAAGGWRLVKAYRAINGCTRKNTVFQTNKTASLDNFSVLRYT